MKIDKSGRELRRNARVSVSLPATVGEVDCITRDLSPSGVFFEVNNSFNEGEKVDFAIQFESAHGKLILKCIGEVVWSENREGKVGLAVKIVDSVLESLKS